MNRVEGTPLETDWMLTGATVPAPDESPLLVVDDEPAVLRTVSEYLRGRGYPVHACNSADEALATLAEHEIMLLLTDISMPGVSGIDLARSALEDDPSLGVVIFTGVPDAVTAVESLRLGVADYLTKPIELDDLEETVQRTLRRRAQAEYRRTVDAWLRRQVEQRTRELQEVMLSSLLALVRAMEAKDPYLKGDSERVAELCEEIANDLDLDPEQVADVRVAGLLHDIGFIGVPESVLRKEGSLTDEEFAAVKRHVEIGTAILEPLTHLGEAVEYVRYHHERLNGSGYPEGLKGTEIPLGAQIVGLADSYVALTQPRTYRPAGSSAEALETLRASAGVWFDQRLITALERAVRSLGE